METVFEKSKKGLKTAYIKESDTPRYDLKGVGIRSCLPLPELSEYDVVKHYTALSKRAFGTDDGFYPLGSCTMKYNPKLHEVLASQRAFTAIHPLAPERDCEGAITLMGRLSDSLLKITGMDAITLEPAAGAHGEFTGLLIIAAYHKARGDFKRNKIIVPDSAHGTNPASASFAGYEVISVKSDAEKGVDIDELARVCGDDTAALMLTNPTTLGLFEKNIKKISHIVHDAGGLLYYDGANLNAVMGIARPGDMGFDVVHLNLHKTFSTPHGGGGPGAGPVGCKKSLAEFLPYPIVVESDNGYKFYTPENSIGKVTSFYGNFGVLIKAYAYILTLGEDGIKEAAETAVLNANYLKCLLQNYYDAETDRYCMHEFVLCLEKLKSETGVSAIDVAKALIDYKMHPPTMYFPTIVHEALMFEPTESPDKETLEKAAAALIEIYKTAYTNPEPLKEAPLTAAIERPDEVLASRRPVLSIKLNEEK